MVLRFMEIPWDALSKNLSQSSQSKTTCFKTVICLLVLGLVPVNQRMQGSEEMTGQRDNEGNVVELSNKGVQVGIGHDSVGLQGLHFGDLGIALVLGQCH
jgi:hypothetical protein